MIPDWRMLIRQIRRSACQIVKSVYEFNEFELRLKTPKNRIQLIAGLNFKTLNTFLSKTNNILAAA